MSQVHRGGEKPKFKPEKQSTIVVNAAMVENISSKGYIEVKVQPQANILRRALTHAKNAGLCRPSESENNDGHTTRVLIMLVSVIPADGITETLTGNRGGFKDQVAFCWAVRGTDLTPTHQDGYISGVMIMPASSVNLLTARLRENPNELLDILERQNGNQPIHRHDGTPATLDFGADITLLPNKSLGGNFTSPIHSKPFTQTAGS